MAALLRNLGYLRRLSGHVPVDFAAITEELYVLLLSGLSRPSQWVMRAWRAVRTGRGGSAKAVNCSMMASIWSLMVGA